MGTLYVTTYFYVSNLECRLECNANQIMEKAAQLSILGETEMLKVLLFARRLDIFISNIFILLMREGNVTLTDFLR